MEQKSNAVGEAVRCLRNKKDWTQEILSARCSVAGVEITRGTLAKIEAGIRGVNDRELYVLARTLKVEIAALFSEKFKTSIR